MATSEFVKNKLEFAKICLEDLKSLNNGYLAGANGKVRQQLIQEFFFHLVGAIDFLSQAINISQNLSIDIEDVKCVKVIEELDKKFGKNNQISIMLNKLHPDTYKRALTIDPYSIEGCLFRIFVYRNTITHQKNHPFHINVIVGGNLYFNNTNTKDSSIKSLFSYIIKTIKIKIFKNNSVINKNNLPTVHLILDTRGKIPVGKNNISNKLALDELNFFWEIVNNKCNKILGVI
jgi:hypothetical protein